MFSELSADSEHQENLAESWKFSFFFTEVLNLLPWYVE